MAAWGQGRRGGLLLVGLCVAAAACAQTPLQTPPRVLLQTPQFRDYGRREGMPDAGSYMAVQDPRGFIWIGTRDGLVRYDGVHFRVFRHDAHDPHGLPGNDIAALLVDARGGLWAGGEGTGLLHYVPGWGFRRWVRHRGDPHSLGGNDVLALAQTPDGSIWVGTYAGGLSRLAPDGRITRLRHHRGDAAGLSSDVVISLHATPDGSLWIGTAAGLDVRRPDGRIEQVAFPAGLRAPVMDVAGSGASLRAVTLRGLFLIDGAAQEVPQAVPVPGGAGVCFSTATDGRGGLWLACKGGLRYRDAAGRWSRFAAQPQLRGGLPAGAILGLLRDREGGLWLTPGSGGLAYLPPDWREFSLFRHVPDDAASLPYTSFSAICVDAAHNILLGGSEGWLGRLDPATGAVRPIDPPRALPVHVDALAEDARGRLWVGMANRLYLRHADGRWQMLLLPWPGVRDTVVRQILPAGADTLYVGVLSAGVARVDLRTLRVTPLSMPHDSDTVQIGAMALHDAHLWVATHAGLLREDAAGALRPAPGIAPGPVDAMAFSGDALWLARMTRLQRYRLGADGTARLRAQVGVAQGWPGARVRGLAVDAAGRVWASTLRGLMRYDPHAQRMDRFEEEPVLAGLSGTTRGFVHGVDGTLFTGVRNGVLAFSPLRRAPPVPPPQPVLTALEAGGQGRTAVLQPRDGVLRMDWRMRDLSVTARALSYLSPTRVRYRFRLTPWSPNWALVGSEGVQNFGRLGPGRYRLEVQAQVGAGGPWGAAAPLRVQVAAPPWASLWARLGYVLLAGLLLWRRRQQQRQRMLLAEERRRVAEQASAAKTRFLAELGHEIRTPMTGVLGMCELLAGTPLDARQCGYVQAIERSGGLLQKLVNDALDLARIEAGRMHLDDAPYDPVVLALELAAAQRPLAAAKGLVFALEMQPAELPHQVLGDGLRVRQILLNLLGNALKFTAQGTVRLAVWQEESMLCFAVSDTGPGIDAALRARLFQRYEQADGPQRSAGSGLGLAISRELAGLMGGSIGVESQPGQGSRFTLRLPLRRASTDAVAASAAVPGRRTPALTVALVEDDATVVQVLGGLLQAQGHRVRTAGDALAALALLADGQPDVMLLDLDLPGIDGFTLARMLRAREGRGAARLPILAVSARSGGDESQLIAAAGMDGFLRKPVSGAALAQALAEVMARRHLPASHVRHAAAAPEETPP